MNPAMNDVFAELAKDIAARNAVGWREYGGPMLADAERDWLQEAYEEALDLAAYLKAALIRREMVKR